MSKLVIIAAVEVAPGRRNQVLPLLMEHRARCLRDEPGTFQFEVLSPLDDENRLLIYEIYLDEAAFETHRKGASVTQWRQEAAGMLVNVQVTRCTPVD
jgi:(4S)-4-hydroxy-5-phosphonooxypentane-2,3-dione isomerase